MSVRYWMCVNGVLRRLLAPGSTPPVEVENQTPVFPAVPQNTGQVSTVGGGFVRLLASDPDVEQSLSFSVVSGALPTGITLTPGGLFTGTAITAGTYTATIRVTDNGNPVLWAERTITFTVNPPAGPSSTPHLPHDQMDCAAATAVHGRYAFLHYIQTFDWSQNSDQTKDPVGTGSDFFEKAWLPRPDSVPWTSQTQWIPFGGWVRDRPLRRTSKPANWREIDMRDQFLAARNGLVDGMWMDILGETDGSNLNLTRQKAFIKGAELAGALCAPITDTSTGQADSATPDPNTITNLRNLWLASPAMWRPGGRATWPFYQPETVQSTTAAARTWMTSVWNQVKSAAPGGVLDLMHIYQRAWQDPAGAPNFDDLPFVKWMGRWGSGSKTLSAGTGVDEGGFAARVRGTYGKEPVGWMRFQDHRPDQKTIRECGAFDTIIANFYRALNGNENVQQLVTGQDWREGASFLPSNNHGYTCLDITGWLLQWWKTKTQPPIVRDVIYGGHRIQRTDLPTSAYLMGKTDPARLQKNFEVFVEGPAENNVAVLAILASPADIEITVCGQVTLHRDVPAGMQVRKAPLPAGRSGDVSYAVIRNNVRVIQMTCPPAYRITTTPLSQDLEYRYYTSGEPLRPAELMPWALPAASTPTVVTA